MWCNPAQTSRLVAPILLVCTEGWRKFMQLEYGNKIAGCNLHDLTAILHQQAITTKQPTSIDTMPMQSMWCNASINTCFSNTTGIQQGGEKTHAVRIWGWMQGRTTCYFEANNDNQTTYQYANCYNGTHVVQPKHRHVLVQKHRFAWRLVENSWELMHTGTMSHIQVASEIQISCIFPPIQFQFLNNYAFVAYVFSLVIFTF